MRTQIQIYYSSYKAGVGCIVAPKGYVHLECRNETFIWNKCLCRCNTVSNTIKVNDLRMRSFWMRTGLEYDDQCSYKRQERRRHRDTQGKEGHTKAGTEVGIMQPHAEDHEESPQPPAATGEAQKGSPLRASRGNQSCTGLDFELLISRAVDNTFL